MANFIYNTALKEIGDGTLDLVSDTIKIMAVTSSYVANRDHDVVDAGGANDPVDHEIDVTGYARGWGGAGRKTIGTKAWAVDKDNDRAEFTCGSVNWAALGNGSNATIQAFIAIKEGVANDTTSRLIAYIDTTTGTPALPYTTDGSPVTLSPSTEGLIQLPTA